MSEKAERLFECPRCNAKLTAMLTVEEHREAVASGLRGRVIGLSVGPWKKVYATIQLNPPYQNTEITLPLDPIALMAEVRLYVAAAGPQENEP